MNHVGCRQLLFLFLFLLLLPPRKLSLSTACCCKHSPPTALCLTGPVGNGEMVNLSNPFDDPCPYSYRTPLARAPGKGWGGGGLCLRSPPSPLCAHVYHHHHSFTQSLSLSPTFIFFLGLFSQSWYDFCFISLSSHVFSLVLPPFFFAFLLTRLHGMLFLSYAQSALPIVTIVLCLSDEDYM